MAGTPLKYYRDKYSGVSYNLFDKYFTPFNAYYGDEEKQETEFHTLSSQCETAFEWVDSGTDPNAVQLPTTFRIGYQMLKIILKFLENLDVLSS